MTKLSPGFASRPWALGQVNVSGRPQNLLLLNLVQESSKSRCAVVIFVNQSSFNSEADFSEYVENIRGLSSNSTGVYFADNPDLFKVRHGSFIDAPGLFALESLKHPGKFLRRANHTIVLERKLPTEEFSKFSSADHWFPNIIYLAN